MRPLGTAPQKQDSLDSPGTLPFKGVIVGSELMELHLTPGQRCRLTGKRLSWVACFQNFSPELVAPFVAWLCHPDCGLTGECFVVGGGRVARMILGVTPGVTTEHPTPEYYNQVVDQLLSVEGWTMPANGREELRFGARQLGIEF